MIEAILVVDGQIRVAEVQQLEMVMEPSRVTCIGKDRLGVDWPDAGVARSNG